uniref:ATP synthase complex subunit 8 n=1 Tax=Scolytinae sp. BMNH 1040075 TaxID=1903782 RepID=A0A343A4R4_9CUCU|nr:ATP synthase F0 subunit 8 [Scolytinae sp. BMNH 1040075]
MPQMAPISWVTLYIMFTIIFMMTCIMNYFIIIYTPVTTNTSKKEKTFSWKW